MAALLLGGDSGYCRVRQRDEIRWCDLQVAATSPSRHKNGVPQQGTFVYNGAECSLLAQWRYTSSYVSCCPFSKVNCCHMCFVGAQGHCSPFQGESGRDRDDSDCEGRLARGRSAGKLNDEGFEDLFRFDAESVYHHLCSFLTVVLRLVLIRVYAVVE